MRSLISAPGWVALALLLPLAAACNNDAQAEQAQPATQGVSVTDFNTLSDTVRQNQTKIIQMEQQSLTNEQSRLQSEQRLAALEQRVGALQQSLVNLTRENQQLQAQLAQTRVELAETQEGLRRLQGQASRARQAVKGYLNR